MPKQPLGFYEFFAGGGLARKGLGPQWECLFANDWCEKKATAYRMNYGGSPQLAVGDVAKLRLSELQGCPALVWASFPCQDLSLAGNGLGMSGDRSSTFWPFWKLMLGLKREGRPAPLITLENVVGAITSNGGADFRVIVEALVAGGYRFAPFVIDAAHFVPQSRPRLFIVAIHKDVKIPKAMLQEEPDTVWHPKSLCAAYSVQPPKTKSAWLWLRLPKPPARKYTLTDVIEEAPEGVKWHSPEETQRLLSLMSPGNAAKVEAVKALKTLVVGTIYKRTRLNESGIKAQRAEIRFDQISGCLRTPVGGSSRQLILAVKGKKVRSRLLSPREAARLMGLDDSYKLPMNYNEAYHLMGDAVVVPVVSWLERHILAPLALNQKALAPSPVRRRVDERTDQSIAAL